MEFFKQVIKNVAIKPRVINTDYHASYIKAINDLNKQDILPKTIVVHRQCRYLNNIIEPDHHIINGITNPMLVLKSFNTTKHYLKGIEAMTMIV